MVIHKVNKIDKTDGIILELTYDEIIDLIGDKTQTGAIPIKNLSRE
jgi:hypothetical protein